MQKMFICPTLFIAVDLATCATCELVTHSEVEIDRIKHQIDLGSRRSARVLPSDLLPRPASDREGFVQLS
jgi:hypothetical protein